MTLLPHRKASTSLQLTVGTLNDWLYGAMWHGRCAPDVFEVHPTPLLKAVLLHPESSITASWKLERSSRPET